jgi:lysophospholipase L1-like esterase
MADFDRDSVIKPGTFGVFYAADTRRGEFDRFNESLLAEGVRPDAVFIGDSLTHYWELAAYFRGTIINRGIGGDISTAVCRRFEADAIQLKPRLIVMCIGANDLGWDIFALKDEAIDTVCESVAAMIDMANESGIPIAVGSLLPMWGPFWHTPEFTTKKIGMLVVTNERLKPIVEERGVIWVDYHSALVDENCEMRHELADDGVHPNSSGYAIMADALRKTLAEAGIEILA